jgi:hypothetical protein
MTDLTGLTYSAAEISRKRAAISQQLTRSSANLTTSTIKSVSTDDLQLLFDLYDRTFFNDWFRENFKGQIKFSLSRRMIKSAGLTLCPKNIDNIPPQDLVLEIRIGVDFFFNYDMIEGNKTVCGLTAASCLEALQLVFEHELCHVIEFIHFHQTNCSGRRFKDITGGLFGHTESSHKLPTNRQIASLKLGLKIGDTVTFTVDHKSLEGVIYRINKRATVLVRDPGGLYVDQKGNRYTKYYVPLPLLR